MKDIITQIREQMNNMGMEELIYIHNYDNIDTRIYDLDEESINNVLDTPWEAIQAAEYGEFNISDDYFFLNGSANIETFDYIDDPKCPIDIDYLADWLADNEQLWDDFGIEVIQETEYTPYNFFINFFLDIDFNRTPFIDEIMQGYPDPVIMVDGDTYRVDDLDYDAYELLQDFAEYIDEDKLTNLITSHWNLDWIDAREEYGTFYVAG